MKLDNKEFWEEQKRIAEKALKESNKAFKRSVVALIVAGIVSIEAIALVLIKIFIL